MNKYNFKDVKISAKNLHIGDVYNYSSVQDFLDINKELELSETERELVDIIFENTTKNECQEILESLKLIKSDGGTEEEKRKSMFDFKPLIKGLKNSGKNVAINLITGFLTDFANHNNLSSSLKDLFN